MRIFLCCMLLICCLTGRAQTLAAVVMRVEHAPAPQLISGKHVADADAPLKAEGIPFVFEKFTVAGGYNDLDNFGKKPWEPVAGGEKVIRRGIRLPIA